MSKDQTERFLELMAYSCAPFNPTSILTDLDDLEADDLTPAVFLEELELVERFASRGFRCFTKTVKSALEKQKSEEEPTGDNTSEDLDDDSVVLPTGKVQNKSQVALTLSSYLLPFYIKRLTRLTAAIERVADSCRKTFFGDMTPEATDELRRLIQMLESGSRPKKTGDLQDVCDLTRGLKWDVPDLKIPGSGKVFFKETATELLHGERTEAPLKSFSKTSQGSAFGRRKGRNPTGFAKFNFAELQALEGDDDDKDGTETPTSERSSRFDMSSIRKDSSADSRESAGRLSRQHSSIDESKTIEIQDNVSDPQWHDKKRKESREIRVRRRIPTGHPNMMKSALVARESLELELESDEETKANTSNNERLV
eukprot:Blabericola_migrator_1__3944@NODE_2198_length_3139_cov_48_463542_g1383_i0_p2_GENE_NODE_2198_length_3139_cov_48_463542_g1383_i0NODE_2198_length_3139_cov_48_463542_g1383_i0_p2_ORF_typecomplete_len369_score77_27HAMP/PF00672_25/0_26_NODE_2198_length_3139_cov_48_463542_g1383_i018352941